MDDFNQIVYFLLNPDTGIVKIGKTENYDKRYADLCREFSCEFRPLLMVYSEDTERQLHSYFNKSKAPFRKEWFYYDDRMKELIQATMENGCLTFPEGEPHRDLPIDQRRKVRQQNKQIESLSHKVNSLTNQVLQTRKKRDEYKQLSSSAGYYKGVLEKQRRINKEKEKRERLIYWSVMLVSILFVFLPAILGDNVPPWAGRVSLLMQLIAYVSANLFFYKEKRLYTDKRMRYFLLAVRIVFFLGMLVSLFSILYIFIMGV